MVFETDMESLEERSLWQKAPQKDHWAEPQPRWSRSTGASRQVTGDYVTPPAALRGQGQSSARWCQGRTMVLRATRQNGGGEARSLEWVGNACTGLGGLDFREWYGHA